MRHHTPFASVKCGKKMSSTTRIASLAAFLLDIFLPRGEDISNKLNQGTFLKSFDRLRSTLDVGKIMSIFLTKAIG
jgi:hypothetical protein